MPLLVLFKARPWFNMHSYIDRTQKVWVQQERQNRRPSGGD